MIIIIVKLEKDKNNITTKTHHQYSLLANKHKPKWTFRTQIQLQQ